jgi:hypothetical protein
MALYHLSFLRLVRCVRHKYPEHHEHVKQELLRIVGILSEQTDIQAFTQITAIVDRLLQQGILPATDVIDLILMRLSKVLQRKEPLWWTKGLLDFINIQPLQRSITQQKSVDELYSMAVSSGTAINQPMALGALIELTIHPHFPLAPEKRVEVHLELLRQCTEKKDSKGEAMILGQLAWINSYGLFSVPDQLEKDRFHQYLSESQAKIYHFVCDQLSSMLRVDTRAIPKMPPDNVEHEQCAMAWARACESHLFSLQFESVEVEQLLVLGQEMSLFFEHPLIVNGKYKELDCALNRLRLRHHCLKIMIKDLSSWEAACQYLIEMRPPPEIAFQGLYDLRLLLAEMLMTRTMEMSSTPQIERILNYLGRVLVVYELDQLTLLLKRQLKQTDDVQKVAVVWKQIYKIPFLLDKHKMSILRALATHLMQHNENNVDALKAIQRCFLQYPNSFSNHKLSEIWHQISKKVGVPVEDIFKLPPKK